MKITETQIRQVIKEEINNVLKEDMHDEDPTSLGLTGSKVATGIAGAVSLNVVFNELQKLLSVHPEWRDNIENFLRTGSDIVQSVIPENKKRK